MSTMTLPVLDVRPARVNAAGVCVHCLTRCNDDPKCVAWYATSHWMVCDRCDGTNWIEVRNGWEGCGCWSGMIEGCAPSPLDDERTYAPMLAVVASA